MANRAYLYSVETLDDSAWDRWIDEDCQYYDSRWTIPLAWFFFFTPSDIVRLPQDGWWEIKLARDKDSAINHFRRRRQRLLSLINPSDLQLLDHFVDCVAQRPGNHLVLQPVEVVENDEEALVEWTYILNAIDDTSADPTTLLDKLSHWSGYPGAGSHYPDPCELTLIGYTYRSDDNDT